MDFARAKAVQQGPHDPAHMGVVVDHNEPQTVEIDTHQIAHGGQFG
jgi:hypothetical protein